MEKVYIVGGLRSYIGIENSMYRGIPAEILGASVLKAIADKYKNVDVDMVIAGNAVGAGGNITRLMMLEAGLSESIPALTVDLQCGSGLESIAIAAAKISCGQSDCIIAGGFESSSTAPRRGYNKNHPEYEKYGGEGSWYKVAKFMPGEHCGTAMLEGAERCAVSENIERSELDKWVLRSHELAKQARDSGVLNDILVEIKDGCNKDEGIRERMSKRLLERLPCVLKEGNIITAANACLTNDGAAFVLMCSEKYIKEHNIKPKAEFMDIAEVGISPGESPKSCVAAIDKLLADNNMDYHDVDVFECNEAFAVIDELFARKYPDAVNRYNIFGGALAYGHPYGASGGIITLHAIKALENNAKNRDNNKSNNLEKCENDIKYAVCSIAAAGGIGTAMLLCKKDKYNELF